MGDGGLYNNDFSHLLRRKAALHLDELKMLYFINPESDRNLDPAPAGGYRQIHDLQGASRRALHFRHAAGQDVDDALIASVKKGAPDVVVLCNTGAAPIHRAEALLR